MLAAAVVGWGLGWLDGMLWAQLEVVVSKFLWERSHSEEETWRVTSDVAAAVLVEEESHSPAL